MKKIVALLFLGLFFSYSTSLLAFGNERRKDFSRRKTKRETISHRTDKGYTKDTWNVYYNGKIIPGISASSFVILNDDYAKDNWNLFYRGKKVRD